MNNKKLISLAACLILATVPGTSSLILADIASETDTKAEQHFEKANELRKVTDYDAAITEYNKVISLSPNSKIAQDAQYWIGQLYFKMGQLSTALSAFQKIIDEHPTSTIIASTKLMIERVQEAKKNKSLFEVARDGDIEHLKELISQGADVNVRDQTGLTPLSGLTPLPPGLTPLHFAAKNGHTDIAAILIKKGANVNAKEYKYDCAPLMYAVWGRNEDMIRLLLDNGAEINITEVVREEPGMSRPFHTAVSMGDIDIIKLLISYGADVNLIGHMGWRPLHWAIYKGDIDIVKLLISSGADVNATAEDGFSPLRHAVGRGNRDLVELLLAKGATGPALHMAACAGDLPKVKRLLKEGRNVDEKDGRGWTPLHWSLGAGQNQVVELLLANGANVNATTDVTRRPYPQEETVLHWTVRTANVEGCRLLISHGADVNVKGKSGWTPLHEASLWNGLKDVAGVLIDKGADIEAKDPQGRTPLQIASLTGRIEVAKVLLVKGADVNAKTKNGRTALFMASLQGRIELAKLLLAKGADVNAKTNAGQTPLHFAARRGHKDVAEILIAAGADVNAQDRLGQTLLSFAEKRGHTEIAQLLRKHGAKE